jgi:hypothetical protein
MKRGIAVEAVVVIAITWLIIRDPVNVARNGGRGL